MIPQEKSKEHRWTNSVLIIITVIILIYVAYVKGFIGAGKNVILEISSELIRLDEKEKSVIGINDKQIFKVTGDGINAYNFEGAEIWSDTFSISNFIVQQKEPYIAVAGKQGKNLVLFNTRGRRCEITTANPIVYFSLNEKGGLVTIESGDNVYTVTAYDNTGKSLCQRVSYVSSDGYPTTAVLSPDNKLLVMSYVSVDDPQVASSILAMKVKGDNSESIDNIAFGYIEKNNLVYKIEYINENTWVCIGDKAITWYDNNGKTKGKQSNLALVFVPEIIKKSMFGTGYLPVIYSDKASQNAVHRQDQLTYYDEEAQQTYNVGLDGGAESFYTDDDGVIVEVNGVFRGFDKLCNPVFEYSPAIDVSKVIYIPSMRKGIAVGKDKVFLLTPKKEKK